MLLLLLPLSGEMVYFHHPDEFCPVSESAYCGAGSVHTMLLHTTGSGVLQLFPGLPASWANAVFHLLKASRGLTVSAVRSGGRTEWIYLTAPATSDGSEYAFSVLDDSDWASAVPQVLPIGTKVAKGPGEKVWMVSIKANESVALYPAGRPQPDFAVAPLLGNRSEWNWWGYNHNMQPLH